MNNNKVPPKFDSEAGLSFDIQLHINVCLKYTCFVGCRSERPINLIDRYGATRIFTISIAVTKIRGETGSGAPEPAGNFRRVCVNEH
jgi:hypothetical protein